LCLQLETENSSIPSPCFTSFFCFTAPCQFTPLDLHPLIFGLMSLAGCCRYAIPLFLVGMSFFQQHSQGVKQGMDVIQCKTDFCL